MVASIVNVNIGILAIQGGFTEHKAAFIRSVASPKLAHLNIKLSVYELRSANDVIDDLDGIVIPGGESTTMGRFLDQRGFGSKIKDLLNNSDESKRPLVWGTCAGLILLSNDLEKQKTGGQFHVSITLPYLTWAILSNSIHGGAQSAPPLFFEYVLLMLKKVRIFRDDASS